MNRASDTLGVLVLCVVCWQGHQVAAADESLIASLNVRDHGARGDGETIDTQAIQAAVDACGAAGGGRVLVPEGRYLTGTLRLRDRVELHVSKGASIVGVPDCEAYSGFEQERWGRTRWNRGLMVGENLRDAAITGSGVIDGNNVFDPRGEERMRGPHTVLLADCHGVTIDGVTVRDSANYAVMLYACSQVRVENATFEGGWDGVHFRGSLEAWNRDLRIARCKFATGDDCIAGHYVEDAIVEDCVVNSSCNGVRIIGPAKRLTFRRCEFFGPGRFEHRTSRDMHRTNMLAALIIQPSAWTPTPGPIEDLCVQDVIIRDVACAFHLSLRNDNSGNRITVERLKATGVYGPALSVESWGPEPLGEVVLRDLDIAYAPDATIDPRLSGKPAVQSPIQQPGADVFARKLPAWGIYGRNVDLLQLTRVRLVSGDGEESRPVVRADRVAALTVDSLHSSPKPVDGTGVECNDVGELRVTD